MSGRTTKVVKLQREQIASMQQQIDMLRHMLEELTLQVAEHNLRSLFHMRHHPVRHHKAGILGADGKPATEMTNMHAVYLEQRDDFAAKLEREIDTGEAEGDIEVRTTGEQARIV